MPRSPFCFCLKLSSNSLLRKCPLSFIQIWSVTPCDEVENCSINCMNYVLIIPFFYHIIISFTFTGHFCMYGAFNPFHEVKETGVF